MMQHLFIINNITLIDEYIALYLVMFSLPLLLPPPPLSSKAVEASTPIPRPIP